MMSKPLPRAGLEAPHRRERELSTGLGYHAEDPLGIQKSVGSHCVSNVKSSLPVHVSNTSISQVS